MGIYPQKAFKLKLQILNSRILQCTYYIYAQVKIRRQLASRRILAKTSRDKLPLMASRFPYQDDIASIFPQTSGTFLI